jgi:Virulence-associated protein E-like domain
MSDQVVSASAAAQPREFTATVITRPEPGAKPTAAPETIEMAAGDDAAVTAAVTIGPEAVIVTSTTSGGGLATAVENNLKFLEQVVVWPGKGLPGWINLHCHLKNDDPAQNQGKPFVIGWPFKTARDLVSRAHWLQNTGGQFFDAWYCTSQQSECTQTRAGKPKAVRLHKNATWLKAIWVDVDVGNKIDPATGKPETKHYDTAAEAWAAVSAWRKKAGLPEPSAVINSGGGLHVYWISTDPLSPFDWRPYAEGLKALLLNEGVKCDAGLTTDDVRILRVPGTFNHKYDPPRPVVLIHLGQMYNFGTDLLFLRSFKVSPTAAPSARPAQPDVTEPGFDTSVGLDPTDPIFAGLNPAEALAAGIAPTGAFLVDPTPIFEQCGFLKEARDTGGKDYDNPLWNVSVLCTAFMESGNAIAHEISRQHPTYAAADTQALFDRKVADRADRGIGYPQCSTIAGLGSKSCATCPLLGKVKSPLNIRPALAPSAPAGIQTGQAGNQSNVGPDWPDGCNKHGTPVRGYANTLVAIRKLKITCRLDTFRQKEVSEGHALPSLDGELSDRAVTMLGDQISSNFSFYPGKELLREALTAECSRNAHNPVVDYFNCLQWDGVFRLKKLFHRYLGADDTPLNEAISTKLMCAIVRRSKRPGCKYDHEVVLQGDQGARKSMFCEDLAVFADLFTDAGDLAGSIKEQMEIAQGKQIIEFAELAGFSNNSRERNKAYLSRRVDRARLAYGHYAKDQPRSSVPIGTTNPGGYLNDPTGERRYWHAAISEYDRDAFLADKGQLYAEAVLREPDERLWLDTPELVAAHDAIVGTAKEPNTLVDDLHGLVGDVWETNREQTDEGWLIRLEERVSNLDVRHKLGLIGVNVHSMRDLGRRMSDAMAALGWTKAAGTLVCKHGGSAEGGYRRPTKDHFEPGSAAPEETTESPTADMKQDTQ